MVSIKYPNCNSEQGGTLVQRSDYGDVNNSTWSSVTKAMPDAMTLADLSFAMTICKHGCSNAIVLGSGQRTIDLGAKQMSCIDGARFAVETAKELAHVIRGAVLASDAFFQFRDSGDFAAKAGDFRHSAAWRSPRDQEFIDSANEHGVVMLMTEVRHFEH